MQADSARLAEKWGKSGLLEGIDSEKEQGNMAMILENQAKQIVAEANTTGTGGTFTAGDGEQWAGVALPLVRKVFAQIVAKDFVSVQPMNLPSGLVFYLDFKYGTSVQGRTDGDNMYGNVSTANSKIAVDTDADGGLYGAGQFGYSSNQFTGTAAAATVVLPLPTSTPPQASFHPQPPRPSLRFSVAHCWLRSLRQHHQHRHRHHSICARLRILFLGVLVPLLAPAPALNRPPVGEAPGLVVIRHRLILLLVIIEAQVVQGARLFIFNGPVSFVFHRSTSSGLSA